MKTSIDFVVSFAIFVAVMMYAFFYPINFFSRTDYAPLAEVAANTLESKGGLTNLTIPLTFDFFEGNCRRECTLEVSGFVIPVQISQRIPVFTASYSPADCNYSIIVDILKGVWLSDSTSFLKSARYEEGDYISMCGVVYKIASVSYEELFIVGEVGTLDADYLNSIQNVSRDELARELGLEGKNFRIVSYFSKADFRTSGFPSGNVYTAEKIAVVGHEISKIIVEVWG